MYLTLVWDKHSYVMVFPLGRLASDTREEVSSNEMRRLFRHRGCTEYFTVLFHYIFNRDHGARCRMIQTVCESVYTLLSVLQASREVSDSRYTGIHAQVQFLDGIMQLLWGTCSYNRNQIEKCLAITFRFWDRERQKNCFSIGYALYGITQEYLITPTMTFGKEGHNPSNNVAVHLSILFRYYVLQGTCLSEHRMYPRGPTWTC